MTPLRPPPVLLSKVTINGTDVPYVNAATSNAGDTAALQAAGYPKPGDAPRS
jgi:hypothetical protein